LFSPCLAELVPDGSISAEKGLLFLFPESGIIFVKFFENGCDDSLSHIFGSVIDLVFVKERIQRIQLPVIEHDGIPVGPFQMTLFDLSSPQNQVFT
jgi:hypothetical protein